MKSFLDVLSQSQTSTDSLLSLSSGWRSLDKCQICSGEKIEIFLSHNSQLQYFAPGWVKRPLDCFSLLLLIAGNILRDEFDLELLGLKYFKEVEAGIVNFPRKT